MKILLIRNDNIGDLICTTPAIEALAKKYGAKNIDIVVNSYNFCAIRNNPFVNEIFSYTKPKHKKNLFEKLKAGFSKLSVLFRIFIRNYDVAVILRSSYSPWAEVFAKIAHPKQIIGVAPKDKTSSITDTIIIPPLTHEVMACFLCLKPLGISYNGENTQYLALNPNKKYKNFVFFHISSRARENKIDKDKILAILELLKANFKSVVISAENSQIGEEISALSGVKYLKTKSFDELANYLCFAKLAITLDGGVTHLAPALKVPTIALFGRTKIACWKPWGKHCIALQDESNLAQNISLESIENALKNIKNEISKAEISAIKNAENTEKFDIKPIQGLK